MEVSGVDGESMQKSSVVIQKWVKLVGRKITDNGYGVEWMW